MSCKIQKCDQFCRTVTDLFGSDQLAITIIDWLSLKKTLTLNLTMRLMLPTFELNPRISCDMEEVRPLCISCKCLNMFKRALPLPLSRLPCVNTPNKVDLPASALPRTATRTSMLFWSSGIFLTRTSEMLRPLSSVLSLRIVVEAPNLRAIC
jgi:hypothetical protein